MPGLLLFGERFGLGTFRFAHAGKTHLLRLTLGLALGDSRFHSDVLSRSRGLYLGGWRRFRCGFLGQTQVCRTLDQILFTGIQCSIGKTLTAQFGLEGWADVLHLGVFDDGQQDGEAVLLLGLLLLCLQATVDFGEVRLKLQALFLTGDSFFLSHHAFDVGGLHLLNHVPRAFITCG